MKPLGLLITFVCAILGICMGICDSWIAPVAYGATLLPLGELLDALSIGKRAVRIILGLFELLESLSNPFDSLADFPLQSWVEVLECYENSLCGL